MTHLHNKACFGAYWYCTDTHHGNRLQSLVTTRIAPILIHMHTGSKSELHLPNNCIQNANLLLSKLIEINQIFTGDMKYIHQRLLGEVNYIDVNVSVRLKWKIGLHFTSYLKSVQDGTYALGKSPSVCAPPVTQKFLQCSQVSYIILTSKFFHSYQTFRTGLYCVAIHTLTRQPVRALDNTYSARRSWRRGNNR